MNHLVRTRSQHLINPPRRNATPLKVKHALLNGRHPKRRRLGSTAFGAINTSDTEETEEECPLEGSRSRKGVTVLNAEAGLQAINGGKRRKRDGQLKGRGVTEKEKVKGEVLGSMDGDSSPKKRKRPESEDDSGGENGSWVEMDEDEEEPEFIAESRQTLAALRPRKTDAE